MAFAQAIRKERRECYCAPAAVKVVTDIVKVKIRTLRSEGCGTQRTRESAKRGDLHRVHRGVDIGQKILLERLDIYGEHGRIANGSALPKSAGRAGDSQSGLSYSKE